MKPVLYSEKLDKQLFSEYVCYHHPKGWAVDKRTGHWVASCCRKLSEANAIRFCGYCEYYFVDPNKKYSQELYSICPNCLGN